MRGSTSTKHEPASQAEVDVLAEVLVYVICAVALLFFAFIGLAAVVLTR